MHERISYLFPLLFPIGQVKRQRRGAGAGPARRALRGGCGDRGLIVLLERGQRSAPAPRAAPGGRRAEPCPSAPAPSSCSVPGATAAPASPPRWELEQSAPFRVASPSLQAEAAVFSALPQKADCFIPQTVPNPGLGRGLARVGPDAVFVGKGGCGRGRRCCGEVPVPQAGVTAVSPGRAVPLWQSGAIWPLHIPGSGFPTVHPCLQGSVLPEGVCPARSPLRAARSLLFLND